MRFVASDGFAHDRHHARHFHQLPPEDSAGHVGRLYDVLTDKFGVDRVFIDIDHIEAGEDFVDVLNRAVASCRALLVVIGPAWLTSAGAKGRRLDDPADFGRLEIAAGLSRNVRVIPVLVHYATMPTASDLPADLAALARRQAVELSDHRWKQDVQALVRALEPLLTARGSALRPRTVAAIAIAAIIIAVAVAIVSRVAWTTPSREDGNPGALTGRPVETTGKPPPAVGPESGATHSPGRVLFDDDFVSQRRLTAVQTRLLAGPSYCRTTYVQDGFLVEAVHATEPCEYLLYEAAFMPNRIRIEVSMRLRQSPRGARETAYGLRLVEAKPDDPDSPLTYRAVIVRVDDFNIVESMRTSSRIVLSPNAENFIRAGEGPTNRLAVEINGRSLRWLLNDFAIGSVTAREPLAGTIGVYLEGQGLQTVFRNLQIVEVQ